MTVIIAPCGETHMVVWPPSLHHYITTTIITPSHHDIISSLLHLQCHHYTITSTCQISIITLNGGGSAIISFLTFVGLAVMLQTCLFFSNLFSHGHPWDGPLLCVLLYVGLLYWRLFFCLINSNFLLEKSNYILLYASKS